MYSFKDYLAVDYTQSGDEALALAAKKRKRDDTTGPVAEKIKEVLAAQRQRLEAIFSKKKTKKEAKTSE
jgi:hypothetical protein